MKQLSTIQSLQSTNLSCPLAQLWSIIDLENGISITQQDSSMSGVVSSLMLLPMVSTSAVCPPTAGIEAYMDTRIEHGDAIASSIEASERDVARVVSLSTQDGEEYNDDHQEEIVGTVVHPALQ